MKQSVLLLSIIFTLLPAGPVSAIECNVDLKGVVTLNESDLVITQNDRSFRIEDGLVYVDDQEVLLNEMQAALVEEYESQLRQTIPPIVDLVVESLTLASVAIKLAFSELFSGSPPDALIAAFDELDAGVQNVVSRDGETTVVRQGVAESLEYLEPLVQKTIASSIAAMSEALLVSLFTGKQTDAAKMAEDAQAMSAKIESELEARGSIIEEQSAALCKQLKSLEAVESELLDALPAFAHWDVVTARQ